MHECLATMDSGNFAVALAHNLKTEGYDARVIPTPCRISRTGCGYCIRILENYIPVLFNKSSQMGYVIREIYRVETHNGKTKYVLIYPA